MNGKLTGSVVRRDALGAETVDAMWRLFADYYRAAERAVFDRDLSEKEDVLLLHGDDGGIHGFTTMKRFDVAVHGRRLRAVFSGNTIIEKEYWGEQELVRTFTRYLADVKVEEPEVPLYWYLICSGFRTYLYLPMFYREFFPRCDRETPPFEQAVIDTLGSMKYPDEYRDGVVRVAEPRECLRPEIAVPPPHKMEHPHIGFFVKSNPGYLRGDELVCLAEVSEKNMRGFAAALKSRPAVSA